MEREIVKTDKAPAAVGPYSQAVRVNHLVFTAGQVGIDPAAGKIVAEDVVGQTHQVMHNLREVLRQAGTDLDMVVKTTVFLQDMGIFSRHLSVEVKRLPGARLLDGWEIQECLLDLIYIMKYGWALRLLILCFFFQ